MESELNYSVDPVQDYDFRKAFWGMSRSDVKISEKSYPASENETHITYTDRFMNLEATVGFQFADDSLIEAGYAFREYFSDPNLYLREFERIKMKLTSIYGQPLQRNEICNICRGGDGCIGSCELGDSKINMVEWHTSRSIITLILVSDELSTEFGILHVSKSQEAASNDSLN